MSKPKSKHDRLLLALAAVSLAAAPALADVVPTGPFTGTIFENFENLQPPGGYPGPFAIFGGAATINDSIANTFVIANVVSSVDTNWENFFPYNGFLMGLIPTGWTVFTFDPPVTRFGGYFGSAAIHDGGTIVFRDAGGAEIGTLPIDVVEQEWNWHGWQSDVPIASITIQAHSTPGKPLVYDDLQIGEAGPACYANCDQSTADPILNVADFSCFLQRFGAGDSYANCDNSTADPVLNVADFSCFLQAFAAGCN